MCVVSMVSDHFMKQYPTFVPGYLLPDISELLRKAAEYDKMTGQPDCPTQDKIAWWKEVQENSRQMKLF